MKRKNASISNADILYNYVHNNCPRRFFIDFYGVSSILSTLFMLCGQIVDKLSSVDKFIIFSIFNNSLFYKGLQGYLPQQFLYFLPLPQGQGSFLPIFVFATIGRFTPSVSLVTRLRGESSLFTGVLLSSALRSILTVSV